MNNEDKVMWIYVYTSKSKVIHKFNTKLSINIKWIIVCIKKHINKILQKKKVDNVYKFVDNFELALKNESIYPHFVYNMFITCMRTGILSTKVEHIKIYA